jgi:hypothetical protein
MGAIQAGLFAITYRYVSRKGDNNPMLSQGAVGAFALVRTLSNIQAPTVSLSLQSSISCYILRF